MMNGRAKQVGWSVVITATMLLMLPPAGGRAGDWPMWRCDAGHTGATADELPETLHRIWTRDYPPREPVWEDPLNRDLMPYDTVFEPVVLGETLFIGFNDSDKLVALDTATGTERWRIYVDGPVRLPPAAAEGKVYFVSDSGYLYCVDATSGALLWKHRGGPSARQILGNRRLISMWPARGGPVIRDGTVYFAASIWPFMGTFIYALDAETGKVQWVNDGTGAQFLNQPHNTPAFAGVAPQGVLVATRDHLLVPGGRSVPACFDRKTGRFLYYRLAEFGKWGGSSVFATDKAFFAHERKGEFHRYASSDGALVKHVRGHRPVLTGEAFYFSGPVVSKHRSIAPAKAVWKFEVDATGDLIKAGRKLYAAGSHGITALELGKEFEPPVVAWRRRVAGGVRRLVAADDKLFAVTPAGRILAFAATAPSGTDRPPIRRETDKIHGDGRANKQARQILERTGVRDGYALVYGAGDGTLLNGLILHSKLHLIVVEPDAAKVDRLRRRYDRAGLYGHRVAVHVGHLHSFMAPPYLASLIVIEDARAAHYTADAESLARIFHSLRPYGGTAWLPHPAGSQQSLTKAVAAAKLPKGKLTVTEHDALLVRAGSLPGAGSWTHLYGNIANTIMSDDQRVKVPMAVLWFGGSSNMDVLPRHGHGPPEQVVGGRLVIQGMDRLSARDVYTGRVLWHVDLKPGTSHDYYDQTYEETPLSTAYNQVHIPGANVRGTNFVATADRVYVLEGNRCRTLDARTGETVTTIALPGGADGREARTWGYLGVYKDLLIAGASFADFSHAYHLPRDTSDQRRSKWRYVDYDKSASSRIVVMDRDSGRERWSIEARYGFIHNAIVAGNATLYCIDNLPPHVRGQLARRGEAFRATPRLLAIDLDSGAVRWDKDDDVFGTWLSLSTATDVLLQSTRPSHDMVLGEEGHRMIAYHASTGAVLWDKNIAYDTPPIVHGDQVIAGGKSYDLRSGEVRYWTNPLTGERREWTYRWTKGCNYPIASEHLLTFRSSAAAFYDLDGKGGTGHFGGFKSGCTANLIAADGVLNAPDYTRTCACAFQNQTSLALVHMPEMDMWTTNDFDSGRRPVRRVGINLGAPGDRRAEDGTLWLDFPSVGGPSPDVPVEVAGSAAYFRHHSSSIHGEGLAWVAASGVEGARTIRIRLAPQAAVATSADTDSAATPADTAKSPPSVKESPSTKARKYTVRLHFAEPDATVQAGDRVFDVALQQKAKLADFDIVAAAGGPRRSLVREFHAIPIGDELTISLLSKSTKPPILCGIEVVAQ